MALKLGKKNKVQKVVKRAEEATTKKQVQAHARAVKLPTGQYVEAVGRRKTATARVRVFLSEGDFVVNNRVVGDYFSGVAQAQALYLKPFEITGTKGKHAVSVQVTGSGLNAQLDAVVHGLSRALVEMNGDLRPLLKSEKLLTRDDRMKETRKMGMGGKSRRKRQSPKR